MLQHRLEPFATEARLFCAWAKGESGEPMDLYNALIRIIAIYRAGLDLATDFEAETSEEYQTRGVSDPDLKAVLDRAKQLPFDNYRLVFDPSLDGKLEDEPVIGSVRDDIHDIFRDVASGLLLFEEGLYGDAAWEWEFNFRIHWSRHAVGALQGLNAHWEFRPERFD